LDAQDESPKKPVGSRRRNQTWENSRDGGIEKDFKPPSSLWFRRCETTEIIPAAAKLREKSWKAFAILEIGINGKGRIAYTI